MRVYFYTGGFTHTLYRDQIAAMPEGTRLIPSTTELFSTGIKPDLVQRHLRSARLTTSVKMGALALLTTVGVPNVRYLRAPRCDLIHSAQYVLLNRQPWVVDFEEASVFAWYDADNLRRPWVRALIRRLLAGPWCRRILPWTEAARDSLRAVFDEPETSAKVQVVYPAVVPRTQNPPARGERPFGLLFVGSAFWEKGGLETILAYQRIRGKEDVRLRMVSDVPPEIVSRFGDIDGLSFHRRIPPDQLESFYRQTDVMVAPLHTDTFGFVLLEAFARGIPCVVTDHFATREIVTDGVTGIVVPNHVSRFGPDRLPAFPLRGSGAERLRAQLREPPLDYVDTLTAAIQRLIHDEALRTRLARAAHQEATTGRFSLSRRRAALHSVYSSAV